MQATQSTRELQPPPPQGQAKASKEDIAELRRLVKDFISFISKYLP